MKNALIALSAIFFFVGCDSGNKLVVPVYLDLEDIKSEKSLTADERESLYEFKRGILRSLDITVYDTNGSDPGEIYDFYNFPIIDGVPIGQMELESGVYDFSFDARSEVYIEFHATLKGVEIFPGKINAIHVKLTPASTLVPIRVYLPTGSYEEDVQYEVKVLGNNDHDPGFSNCDTAKYNTEDEYLWFYLHVLEPYDDHYVDVEIGGNQMLLMIDVMDYVNYGVIKTMPSINAPVSVEIEFKKK